MQAVARRAEVAPGTVLYHYPTPEALADAVVDSWIETMEPPSADQIDPEASLSDRISILVKSLYELYERTGHLYRVYQKSPGHPSLVRANEWWEQNVGEMLSRAMGERVKDAESMSVVSVLINPGFKGTLLSSGIEPARAVEIASKMALSWLSD